MYIIWKMEDSTFMPKIRYYDDVKIIKKPFKKRFLRVVSFFCIVVVFSLCIVVSNYFSSAISVSGVFSSLVYGGEKIKIKEKKYYAVVLGSYDDIEEAKKVALGSTIQGASGYVWSDDKHYVIGSVYYTKEDGNKVIENLKDSNYEVSLKEIVVSEINMHFDDYENKDVRKIENALNFLRDTISQIYEYSISFDKSEINNLAVSSNLSNVRGEIKVLISEMQFLLNTQNDNLQKIQNTLIKTDQLLNEVILKTIDNTSTGYVLKNTIASLVRFEYELYGELA